MISAGAAESHKHRKIDQENKREKRFLRKQREEEDFWDELEEFQSESSSDESNIKDSSFDEPSSDEDNVEVDKKQGDNIHVRLGDQDRGVQLGDKERSFRPVSNNDAGSYLQEMKGCGSSTKEERERQRNWELEKLTSRT